MKNSQNPSVEGHFRVTTQPQPSQFIGASGLNAIATAVRSDSELIARVVSDLDGAMMGNQSATQAQATELTQTRAALEMIRAELANIASMAGNQRVGP